MNMDNLFNIDENRNIHIPPRALLHITLAVTKVYPFIVLANLTKNTYYMIRDEGFLHSDIASSGSYDDLIENNVPNIHENYQEFFLQCFSRESLIREYEQGKTEIYAELYQKDREDKYRWVSTHAIKISDNSNDIIQICLNRSLDNIVEKRHSHV